MKRLLIEFHCADCGARFRNREAVPDDAGAVETACVVCHRPLRMPLPPRAEQLDFPEAA
jgi:hypothetical protein